MECLLFVHVAAQGSAQYEQLLLNLSADKPLFEDEVESEWRALFGALEFLEVPERLRKLNDFRLLVAWELSAASSPARYISALHLAGVEILGALEAFEDGGYCFVDSQAGSRTSICFEEQVFFNPDRVVQLLKK